MFLRLKIWFTYVCRGGVGGGGKVVAKKRGLGSVHTFERMNV